MDTKEILLIIGLCMYALHLYINLQFLKINKQNVKDNKESNQKFYELQSKNKQL